jgi:hypothetical protein
MSTPSLADVILTGIEDRLRELNTSEPGEIVSYDATTQTARVRPLLARAVPDDDNALILEYAPDVFDVPVMFPRSLKGYLTFPIGAGDTGLLVYPMRDIGQWRATGQRGDPGDNRICTMAGAVFIPGLVPDSQQLANVSTSDVVLGVLLTAKLLLGGPTASDYVALSSKVETELTKIKTAISGAGVLAGDGGATFKTNIIAALNASTMGATGSTAATKVKAL